jgi:hypothetical protein
MTWWPGWDSIESTNGWAHFWFWAGMLCFFFLGFSEIVAFTYGLRKDQLVRIADIQRQQEQNQADDSHAKEIGGLKGQLSEADKKLAEIERLRTARHLTETQKQDLAAALVGKPIGRLTIKASATAPDAKDYADEIAAVFDAAGWKVPVDNAMFMGGDTSGVWITIHDANIPEVANIAFSALRLANIPIRDGARSDAAGPSPDEAWLKIGLIN